MPLIAGRILGWLMICDPPEQSAGQIAEAIGASKASLSANLRLLDSIGFLAQRTKPGDRVVYYRAVDDPFSTMIRRQLESMSQLNAVLDRGVALAGPGPRGARVRRAHEVFDWLGVTLAKASPPKLDPKES